MPPATHIEIRRARPEDAAAIKSVLHESFVEFKSLYTDGAFSATTPGPEQVIGRMREGPIWIAALDGVALGTVAAVIKDAAVYIRGMGVVPAARGSGTGSRLLQQVEIWAVHEGYARMFLVTTPFLHSAIRLYERSGFRRTEGRIHDLFGTPLLTMEKSIITR